MITEIFGDVNYVNVSLLNFVLNYVQFKSRENTKRIDRTLLYVYLSICILLVYSF